MTHMIEHGLDELRRLLRGDESVDCPLKSLYRRTSETHGLVLLTYPDAWSYTKREADWTTAMRLARGIVFDSQTFELVSLPLIKFFYPQEFNYEWAQRYRWMEKADGVMIQAFRHRGQWIFASRHGIETPPAQKARSLILSRMQAIEAYLPFEKSTLVMELCDRDFREPGMLDYGDAPRIYLLGVRDLESMVYYPASILFPQEFQQDNVVFVIPEYSTDVAVEKLHANDFPLEGFVLYNASNPFEMYKLKTSWYVNRLQRLRRLTFKQALAVYQEEGLSGVEQWILANADIADDTNASTWLPKIREAESHHREQAMQYATCEQVHDVPTQYRWAWGSYRQNNFESFEKQLRRMVAKTLGGSNER